MAKPKKPSKRIPVREWRVEALRLHVEGWSYAQIATQLDKSNEAVREGIAAELSELTANFADDIKQRREIKSAQLDKVIRGSMVDAEAGVPAAAAVVTAAIREQIRLFGLAAAEKVDVTGALTLSIDARQVLLDRITKIAEAQTKRDDKAE